MQKIHIRVVRIGEDSGTIIQTVDTIEQARKMVNEILPPLLYGYHYQIKL